MSDLFELLDAPDKIRGLGQRLSGGQYVALLLVLIGFALSHFRVKEILSLIAIAVPLTVVLYRLGASFDDLLFDPLFNPDTDEHSLFKWLGKRMRDARRNAACFLETGERNCVRNHSKWTDNEPHKPPTRGIYKKAEALYHHSPEWNKRVEPILRLSKAARCFILPLALVFVYGQWPFFLPRLVPHSEVFKSFSFLGSARAARASLFLGVVLTCVYLFLRLAHMQTLYELVAKRAEILTGRTLQLEPSAREEVLFCQGCLYLIGPGEIRQVLGEPGVGAQSSAVLTPIP